MNAPDPNVAYRQLFIKDLAESPTNPRRRFNQVKLDELAANIKEVGIVQPLLVRPWPNANWPTPNGAPAPFEIVAGHRRFRAANIAGLEYVPCIVRELDDLQVIKLQLIENVQREDLHPMEEAETYAELLKHMGVDDIALQIGKSRAYIYARMKLLDLVPKAREAFFDDKLTLSTALYIARMPPVLQRKGLKAITEGDEPMSARIAFKHLQDNFMLRLAEAPFDIKDEKLVEGCGACSACPKRTGNQPELFGDVESADVCTDPICFGEKRAAHFVVIVKKHEAAGGKVFEGKEAKKLYWPQGILKRDYVELDSIAEVEEEDDQEVTVQQLLDKKNAVAKQVKKNIVLIERFDGSGFEKAISIEDYERLVGQTTSNNGHPARTATPGSSKEDQAKQRAAREVDQAHNIAMLRALHNSVPRKKGKELGVEDLRDLVAAMLEYCMGDDDVVAELNSVKTDGGDGPGEYVPNVEALDPQQLTALLLDLLYSEACRLFAPTGQVTRLKAAAARAGIDVAKLRKEVIAARVVKKVKGGAK